MPSLLIVGGGRLSVFKHQSRLSFNSRSKLDLGEYHTGRFVVPDV